MQDSVLCDKCAGLDDKPEGGISNWGKFNKTGDVL